MMLGWLRRWWQNDDGPLPKGLVCLDVPPPEPTDTTPEELMDALTPDYDG